MEHLFSHIIIVKLSIKTLLYILEWHYSYQAGETRLMCKKKVDHNSKESLNPYQKTVEKVSQDILTPLTQMLS